MKRSYLITGANKGIGLACVKKILESTSDAFVLLGSRNKSRGEKAVSNLNESHKKRVAVIELDVGSDESVSKAAKTVKEGGFPSLHGILNNAGITGGLVDVLNVNFFGVVRVTNAFLPLLDTKVGRIVNQSSGAASGFCKKVSNPETIQFLCDRRKDKNITTKEIIDFVTKAGALQKDYEATDDKSDFAWTVDSHTLPPLTEFWNIYGLSKAALNSYTLALAHENKTILCNACSPGFIETDLTRPLATNAGMSPKDMGMLAVEKSTVSPLYLLLDPSVTFSGRYYGSDGKRSPLDKSRDPGTPEYDGRDDD